MLASCSQSWHIRPWYQATKVPDLASAQDLKQALPELGRGLQQLLDFDGDVEATFARNFEARLNRPLSVRCHFSSAALRSLQAASPC